MGFVTPLITLAEEDVDKEKAKHHITAQRVGVNMTKGLVGDIERGKMPTSFRTTTASNNVPRTIIHRIPDNEIKSRGLRAWQMLPKNRGVSSGP
jgi:hypothetical protein